MTVPAIKVSGAVDDAVEDVTVIVLRQPMVARESVRKRRAVRMRASLS
jgi:hypothetical protein